MLLYKESWRYIFILRQAVTNYFLVAIHSRFTAMLRQLHTLLSLSSTPKACDRKKCSSLEPLHSNFDSNSQTSCKKTSSVVYESNKRLLRAAQIPIDAINHICGVMSCWRCARYSTRKGKVSCCLAFSAPFCSNKSTRLLVIVLNNNKFSPQISSVNKLSERRVFVLAKQQQQRAESALFNEVQALAPSSGLLLGALRTTAASVYLCKCTGGRGERRKPIAMMAFCSATLRLFIYISGSIKTKAIFSECYCRVRASKSCL